MYPIVTEVSYNSRFIVSNIHFSGSYVGNLSSCSCLLGLLSPYCRGMTFSVAFHKIEYIRLSVVEIDNCLFQSSDLCNFSEFRKRRKLALVLFCYITWCFIVVDKTTWRFTVFVEQGTFT